MPGVESLLTLLDQKGIRRCVVTNSFRSQVDLIRTHQKVLQTIPHWITREDYENPKPAPDGYLRAIELYGQPGDRVVGFEDSLRGIQSLQKTPALPVLVCSSHHPLLPAALSQGVLHFNSLGSVSIQ
jgi:beta-phosphoglucomutase